MPLKFFKGYLQNNISGLNKVLGIDGTMNTTDAMYVMSINIHDQFTNIWYDYITHIINTIHNEIFVAQKGQLKNFKFNHYSLLMHLILYKNLAISNPTSLNKWNIWKRTYQYNDGQGYGKYFILMKILYISTMFFLSHFKHVRCCF